VRFEVYRVESQRIREVFHRFTDVVEPLSLDEAYLDITDWQSSGASVAREIREEIREVTGLTASAGIAPNKLLAKIASDWNKPNGQFEVLPKEVDAFMRPLPVRRLWGVGEKTAGILAGKGIETCGDLQGHSLPELHRWLGKFGIELYHQCRGKDDRSVKPSRERKSLSNERTFPEDLMHVEQGLEKLMPLWHELCEDLSARHSERAIKSVFIKLKFHDFRQTTVERQAERADWEICEGLMMEGWQRASGRGIRLIGVGVRFQPVGDANGTSSSRQLWLFEDS
jgi:DNA polymerase-4